ncbi:alpha-glucosidase [Deinococcus soli (ex Cha et al. 2016)]|uniref:Oligo-1,6-glucosidase n=2 Tax=Deinococcus soli (ex Cha et al. 2016) TaxID=1309411 RepID=A0AAE3XHM8_9DEIO|nr:alpha-glucosidase [Deinococcus soli (ex Cha et al. 2016)]MDR6220853.1 oligo-1,6-glucosidase [Deinococcus soli (ex Cha et al. 2016)]MDR6330847.1 oligo-1,6-glucosidase [Deinococcus soli (ex Cha et al. 2016)]MDR6753952.1 oligo-1,6-glucosidase [Deinococcus soli (ex Cha et al. 2016)]
MSWWKQSVVYQIYPRSFKDTTGDGVGDLRGITEQLDYIARLGPDVLWLCPVYASPNVDNGYDISDYRAIMPEFGTMDDFRALLDGAHARGLRVIMDLVVNHTSDQHEWFQQARRSTDNPYREFYIWRPPAADGGPPSNWGSHFGGSAWTLDEGTGEYYLHLFAAEQPDLNWAHPPVREAVFDMMRFWLDLGVDGFRMDTINMLSKNPDFPDVTGAHTPYPIAEEHFLNGPDLHRYLQDMKREVLSHYDLLTVGETPGVDPTQATEFTHPERGTLSMIFQFDHMRLDTDRTHWAPRWTSRPWTLTELRDLLGRWQHELYGKGWNSLYLSNHDVPRMVSRFGNDGPYRVQSAKMLATLLFTLQGTPYIYQGDELGMTNVHFDAIDDYRDVDTLNFYREARFERHLGEAEVMAMIWRKSRDNARTPFPWNASANGGFTTGVPWMPLNPNYPQINAEQAQHDPQSVYWYYRTLIRLRREHAALVDGRYGVLLNSHPAVYAYTRTLGDTDILTVLHFSDEPGTWPSDLPLRGDAHLLISNYDTDATDIIRPFEARVYRQRTIPAP